MKKINIIAGALMLMGAVTGFSSCDSDLDNNPTLKTPTSFKLNKPAYASATIDLASSDSLAFTWSQPDYGFPLQSEYQLEVSLTNSWNTSYDQTQEDNSLTADYALLGDVTPYCNAEVSAASMAKALQQVGQWAEDAVPSTQTAYIRCYSLVNGDTIYSNPIEMTFVPYYVELKDADPNYWYLIGACIGDGKWTNDALGTSIMPLYPITGETYDAKTGDDTLSWTGYLTTDGFKLIHVKGSWDEQVGSSDGGTTIVWNDGGSSNICVSENGIYTVTLKTTSDVKKNELSIKKFDGTHAVYPTMYITGDFDDWGGNTAMNAFSTYTGAENHDWVYDVTISADGGVKFKSGDTWWGSSEFSWGTALTTGGNIPAKAGSYKVFFNDITGQYNFIAQ
jgi:hypothetical protein